MNNEHFRSPITFRPIQVLRNDGLTLEADDFTPETLHDFVTTHADPIATHIESIYASSRGKATESQNVQKETILIARLALRGSEHVALSWGSYQNPKRFYDSPTDLNETYRPYFTSLQDSPFKPRVRNRSAINATGTTGIWLGVTLP